MDGLLGWLRRFEAQPSIPVVDDLARPSTFQSTKELEDGALEYVNMTLRVNYMSLFPHLIAQSKDAELDIGKLEEFVRKKKTLPELLYSNYTPFGRPMAQLPLQELRTAFELKVVAVNGKPDPSEDFVRYLGPRKRLREEGATLQAEKRLKASPGLAKTAAAPARSRTASPAFSTKRSPATSSSPAYRRSATPAPAMEAEMMIPHHPAPPPLPPGPAPYSRSYAPLPPGPPPPTTAPPPPLPPGPPPSQQQQGDEMEDDDANEEDFELKTNGHSGGEIVPPQVKKAMKMIVKALINIKDWPIKGQKINPFAVRLVRGQKNPPVPDHYFDKIKRPMDLTTIKERVDDGFYANFQQFALDVRLVAENALEWNLPDSSTYPLADHFKRKVEKELNAHRGNLNGHF